MQRAPVYSPPPCKDSTSAFQESSSFRAHPVAL